MCKEDLGEPDPMRILEASLGSELKKGFSAKPYKVALKRDFRKYAQCGQIADRRFLLIEPSDNRHLVESCAAVCGRSNALRYLLFSL